MKPRIHSSQDIRKFRFKLMIAILIAIGCCAANANGSQSSDFVYPTADEVTRNYNFQRNLISFLRPLLSALVLFLLIKSGSLKSLQDQLSKVSKAYPLRALTFMLVLVSVITLFDAPLDFYSRFVLEHHVGLSNQSLSSFFIEKAKSLGLTLCLIPFTLPVLEIMRRCQRHWAVFIWISLSILATAGVFLKPLIFDTAFNNFQNLQTTQYARTAQKIQNLCQQAELDNVKVYLVDRSKQSKKINAYVTGITGSTRIVLFDTLLERLPEDEVLMVVSHEIGHYKLKHIYIGLALSTVGLLLLVLPCEYLLAPRIHSLPKNWGIETKSDLTFAALLLTLYFISVPIVSPIECAISRQMETEADDFAIRLNPNPMAAARLFRDLSQMDKAEPNPPAIIEFWIYTHPSIKHRIDRVLKLERN